MQFHLWPILKPEQAEVWEAELAAAANTTGRLADRVSPYPGGGIPATKLREATRLLDEARAWLREER